MASFKDKIKMNKPPQTQERVYFPKTLGIYTTPNPKVDKREYQPEVIALPPTHRSSSIEYKGDIFSRVSYWLGILYKEPIVINIGTYPANALYSGTDTPMFANSKNTFDKRIPMVGDEFGVNIPDTYDVLTTVVSERDRLLKRLKGPKVSDKLKAFVEKELEKLANKEDNDTVRTTHNVLITPKLYIPVLMADVEEVDTPDGDIEEKFTPTLAIFEQSLGAQFAEPLLKAKKITNKYDAMEVADYLFSEVEDNVGQPVYVFNNPLAIADKTSKAAYCVKEYTDKPSPKTAPYFNISLPKDVDERTLMRVIILEMIGLYPSKEDKDSPESLLKAAIYEEIKSNNTKNI